MLVVQTSHNQRINIPLDIIYAHKMFQRKGGNGHGGEVRKRTLAVIDQIDVSKPSFSHQSPQFQSVSSEGPGQLETQSEHATTFVIFRQE